MHKNLADSKVFYRFLEIVPGVIAITMLLLPFILAPTAPIVAAYLILAFNFYWFVKAFNVMRHMVNGFRHMGHCMKIDYLERCKIVSANPDKLLNQLKKKYQRTGNAVDYKEYMEIANLDGHYDRVKNWEDVYHVFFITNYQEEYYITEPTYEAIRDCNYPNDKIIIVSCGERRDEENYLKVKTEIERDFSNDFLGIYCYMHDVKPGEVIGKGANLYQAMTTFYEEFKNKYPNISPNNVIATTLDADHIIHSQYLAELTYRHIIDPNRDHKTYQPNILMFNNIWDAPSPSRVLAVSSSFWQMVESMRPYRLRTFASHSQSLSTLIDSDFVSRYTVVEDGHQYWRTYFAYSGDHEMTPIYVPIYHDTVLGNSFWDTMENQYKQRRRWAWGISDFPYIVTSYMKHPEIPLGEKLIQSFRHIAGHISWSTAAFIIAFSSIPLLFNSSFQDTVLAHNVSIYSSTMFRLAWVFVFANAWLYYLLLPPLPKRFGKTKVWRYSGMFFQWIIAPVVSLLFSSLPALESQIRLMFGQSLNVFWTTPKVRAREK